jgi:hypothetical protein
MPQLPGPTPAAASAACVRCAAALLHLHEPASSVAQKHNVKLSERKKGKQAARAGCGKSVRLNIFRTWQQGRCSKRSPACLYQAAAARCYPVKPPPKRRGMSGRSMRPAAGPLAQRSTCEPQCTGVHHANKSRLLFACQLFWRSDRLGRTSAGFPGCSAGCGAECAYGCSACYRTLHQAYPLSHLVTDPPR